MPHFPFLGTLIMGKIGLPAAIESAIALLASARNPKRELPSPFDEAVLAACAKDKATATATVTNLNIVCVMVFSPLIECILYSTYISVFPI